MCRVCFASDDEFVAAMLAESTYVDTYTDVELTHYMQQHQTDAEYLRTLLENGGGILRGVQVA